MIPCSKPSPCVGIRTCSDYSPFGVELDGRTVSLEGYRFGYQGFEKDNEFKGDGNSYTTEFRQLDPRLGRWLSVDPLNEIFPEMSPYNSVGNSPIFFVDVDGKKIVPSNDFLSTDYGRVFQNLRVNNSEFGKSIEKFENNTQYNLYLWINDTKCKSAGAAGLTKGPEKPRASRTANVNSWFLSSTDVSENTKFQYSELGVVLIVAHEAIHQKLSLSPLIEDANHNIYNTEREALVKILTEYSIDNNLNLSKENIDILSFAGQQKSKEFEKYISDLAHVNNLTFEQQKKIYDKSLSKLIHVKKVVPITD